MHLKLRALPEALEVALEWADMPPYPGTPRLS